MFHIKVQVYAGLKEYFNTDFDVEVSDLSIKGLKDVLEIYNPESSHILTHCRFAVNDSFISGEYKLNEHDKVFVLPPSSGG